MSLNKEQGEPVTWNLELETRNLKLRRQKCEEVNRTRNLKP